MDVTCSDVHRPFVPCKGMLCCAVSFVYKYSHEMMLNLFLTSILLTNILILYPYSITLYISFLLYKFSDLADCSLSKKNLHFDSKEFRNKCL